MKSSMIWWGVGGALWGVVIALGSLVVAGGGHGWVSAWPFGFLAVFTTPFTTMAWAQRKTSGGKWAVFALVIAVLADALLFAATLTEGTRYFFGVFPLALQWLLLWSSWQILAVVVLLYRFSNFPVFRHE